MPSIIRITAITASILVEREPIYRLGEVVSTFAPSGFGLSREEAGGIRDDAIGRALDRLFDADRDRVDRATFENLAHFYFTNTFFGFQKRSRAGTAPGIHRA